MDILEKKIEEAAQVNAKLDDWIFSSKNIKSFIKGAKSPEAKAFHQKGLYTEEDIKFYATRFAHQCRLNECATNNDTCNLFDKWFEEIKQK